MDPYKKAIHIIIHKLSQRRSLLEGGGCKALKSKCPYLTQEKLDDTDVILEYYYWKSPTPCIGNQNFQEHHLL
jgi:hypothetical protein